MEQPKRKYKNKKVTVNGIKFDSQKEAKRYIQLADLERVGMISDLQLQRKYELIPAQYIEVDIPLKTKTKKGKMCVERACSYIADFVYKQGGETIVEDVKGYRQAGAYSVFTIKRKLMLERYGIVVREV